MTMKWSNRRSISLVAATGLVAALALSGCSSSSSSSSAAVSPTTAAPIEIAYLSASSANTWLQASKTAMDEIAAANNMKLTTFDAQFKPGEQSKQVQDVLAAGKYKAIIISSVDGAGIIPDLQAAIAKGLKVGILNQIVGAKLDTSEPQFAGPSVSVLAAPLRSGERLGKLTLQACVGISPCRVVYFYGIKGIPLDNALKLGFDSIVKANPAIQIVAEGEGKYAGPDVAQKALADIMQKTKNFDVVIGSDQSIQGALLALTDAGKTSKVKLIGLGGSKPAIDGITAGTWFGDVFGAPVTEGKLLMNAMVEALKTGKVTGGIDPATTLPDEGLVTKANVAKFTAEWNG
jgi:ribose transport system substrate-binding protein